MQGRRYRDFSSIMILSVVVSLSMSEGSSAATRCPRDLPYTSEMALFHGSCYQFVSLEKYWPQARDHCLWSGGRLVKVDDPQTNEFIVEKLNGLWWQNNGVWIGIHDIPTEMRWQWTGFELNEDESVLWTNWGRGHPGAFLHTRRDCVRMVRNDGWKWHETFCNSLRWKYRFICEYNAINSRRAIAVHERSLEGQSSLNSKPSIHKDGVLEHPDREYILSDSSPQVAAAVVQADDEIASNEGGNNKSAVIAVAVVCVLGGTLTVVALLLFYRRRRRWNTAGEYSIDNCVGSKGKKIDDGGLTEASSFRPSAVSNIYVEADPRGRVRRTRLAPEPRDGDGDVLVYDSSDEETDDHRSGRRESAKRGISQSRSGDIIPDAGGYDVPKAINIYAEIPDGSGDYPDNRHIYETLEDVRR